MSAAAKVEFTRVVPGGSVRLVRDGLSVVGVIVFGWFAIAEPFIIGIDSYAYWHVDPADPYVGSTSATIIGGFMYSPVAAQAMVLLNWLPWGIYVGVWTAILVAALAWVGRWWTLALLAFPPVVYSIWLGNIDMLLAAAMVAGFRYPAAWAFVLLTKVAPGVGLLWFVVRREWRSLAIAIGVSAAIAAVSFAIDPSLWFAWPAALLQIDDGVFQPVPLWIRFLAAAALVVWGARTDRRWTVVVAGAIAIPWISARSLAMLVGVVPLLGRRSEPDLHGPVRVLEPLVQHP